MKYTLYTVPNCSKCDLVSNLIKEKGFDVDKIIIPDMDNNESNTLYKRARSTVGLGAPIIERDGELITLETLKMEVG